MKIRKYKNGDEIGIMKLDIKPKTENIIEIILIFFALFSIIILFCIPIFSHIYNVKLKS